MMNVYYEYAPAVTASLGITHLYWARYNVDDGYTVDFTSMRFSNRVWVEDEFKIKYIKYRWDSPAPAVDLKEFMWVKLRSKEL